MKTRTMNLLAIHALLAIGLSQALPSYAEPAPTGPAAPSYISPGVGFLLSIFHWI